MHAVIVMLLMLLWLNFSIYVSFGYMNLFVLMQFVLYKHFSINMLNALLVFWNSFRRFSEWMKIIKK